jgi:branched-chain amino acid transport system ATP-binding protein
MTIHRQGENQAAALSVSGLSLSFGGTRALRDVSFDVEPGTITALIGPNGSGKISMFNCISDFYRPSTGRILMDGRDVSRVHAPERAKLGFARTFQNIALFRGMTVLETSSSAGTRT